MYSYATFDEAGNCTGITEMPVEVDWPHPVAAGTLPDDIFWDGEEICQRELIEINADRTIFLSDGMDAPNITGAPSDAVLEVNGIQGGEIAQSTPLFFSVRAIGKYRSVPILLRCDTLEAFQAEFISAIDAEAGQARLAIVTDSPGQSAVYAAKLIEAHDYLNGGAGPFFYVTSEAEAEEIISRAEECNAALAAIEAKRLGAKAALRAATDIPAILAAAAVDWSETDEPS